MIIQLHNIGKRFNQNWIFRNINYTFQKGYYSILGENGSGKSTLIQLIAGSLSPSEGSIHYEIQDQRINPEAFFQYLSLATLYLELIEEFTLQEAIDFHFKFRQLGFGLTKYNLIEILGLKTQDKPLKNFSSGMKQRVRLGLAFLTDAPILLLDEPTSNLDQQGIDWYRSLIEKYTLNRVVIICSNQQHEYDFCTNHLSVLDFKK